MRFTAQRYLTKGVQMKIPVILQMVIWSMIDGLDIEKDYLQVFQLSVIDGKQSVVHIQEEPDYEKNYVLDIGTNVNAKVYVIDDETYCTMLLAEEY